MASWICLPTLLVWAWAAGGIFASPSITCGNCEEKDETLVCEHPRNGEGHTITVYPTGVLQLHCQASTTTLNFSSLEDCSFPSVEVVEIQGCPLMNASFGDVFLQLGIFPENVTKFVFSDRNEKDQQLESWHLDGLVSLMTLEFLNNGFQSLPEYLFSSTPNLRIIRVALNSFNTIHENLFFNTPDLQTVDFERNRLENLPDFLLANLSALANVSFSSNYISEIQPDFFIDNINLQYLDLSHNQIPYFSSDFFRNQKLLKYLSLQGNAIEDLPKGIFVNLESLENVDLSSNVLKSIPDEIFDRSRKVKKIDISNNSISELPNEIFMRCSSLESLDLSRNNLQKLLSEMFPTPDTSLTYLNLGHNNISFALKASGGIMTLAIPEDFPLSRQVKLKEILLNDNRIDRIPHAFNRLFVNLVSIDLSGNVIHYIHFNSLYFLQDSITLNLRNNNLKIIDLHDIYPRHKKKVKMFLEGNYLDCDCSIYRFAKTVQGNREIGNLTMDVADLNRTTCNLQGSEVLLKEVDLKLLTCVVPEDKCIKNCSCVWRQHDSMFIVNCSFQKLQELPDLSVIPSTIISITLNMKNNSLTHLEGLLDPQYRRIVNLTVSNNKLSFINASIIPETLKILDISGNNITVFPKPMLEVFNSSGITLSLGRNPWICNCDLIDFLNFLHVPSRKVTDFEDIRCVEDSDSLLDLTEYSLCPFFMQPMVIITLVAIGAFLLLFAVLGTVSFYKYNQGIKVWLYAHHMCLWAITEDELDADKKFDAFISYSHKDEEFVNTVLVPGLESGDPKYRVCLHYRDWVPGEFIQNQILQSVKASRRTIVVLSSNFIESVWGQLEFKAAHSQALQDRTNRIIVIVYGEVPPENELDEKLKLYIATRTYVKWGDAKFWEKLRYIMPHPPKKLN